MELLDFNVRSHETSQGNKRSHVGPQGLTQSCEVPLRSHKILSDRVDEPPGSVHSEIMDSTYNLSPISLTWPFTKPNVASLAQVELY